MEKSLTRVEKEKLYMKLEDELCKVTGTNMIYSGEIDYTDEELDEKIRFLKRYIKKKKLEQQFFGVEGLIITAALTPRNHWINCVWHETVT